jgi:hypothetical protein
VREFPCCTDVCETDSKGYGLNKDMTYLEHEIFLSKLSYAERAAYDLERDIQIMENEVLRLHTNIENKSELLAVLKRGLSK